MVDPLRYQPASLVQRGFRMMDAIQSRAGLERGHVVSPELPQVAIRRHHGALATTRDLASFLAHAGHISELRVNRKCLR